MSEIKKLGALLKEKNIKISGAESCTGGMVAAEITSVDGISAVFCVISGYIFRQFRNAPSFCTKKGASSFENYER